MTSISYIVPSLNRETLHRTIASIEMREGDEICVEFDIPRTYGWGNAQRNKAIARAKGDFLAFIDDDDFYLPGHREKMEQAIQENPDIPTLFRFTYPNGDVIWKEPVIEPGNVSTAMILVPNDKTKLHTWEAKRNMADFLFINKWKWDRVAWNEHIIAQAGHDDGKAIHHE